MKRGYCSTFWQIFSYNHINSCCFSYVKLLFSVINILNQFFKKVMYQVKKLILLLQISLVLAILMLLWEKFFFKESFTNDEFVKRLSSEIAAQLFQLQKKGKEVNFPELDVFWKEYDDYLICTPCSHRVNANVTISKHQRHNT